MSKALFIIVKLGTVLGTLSYCLLRVLQNTDNMDRRLKRLFVGVMPIADCGQGWKISTPEMNEGMRLQSQ